MVKNSKLSSFKEMLRERRIQIISGAGFLLASLFIIYLSFVTYANYRRELIRSEQEELLTMAETVGKSLVNYVEQELNSLDLYFAALEMDMENGRELIWQAAGAYLEQKNGLYDAVVCYAEDGSRLYQKGEIHFDDAQVLGSDPTDHTVICGKQFCDGGWYEMFLARTCRLGGSACTFIYAMNLDTLYSYTVQPVRIGEGGYSVVKDRDLAIIMHHAANQIGMDAIYDREERYPQLDLTDLTRWIELQRTQEEGYDIINSYVWDDPNPTPAFQRRIVAYTTIHLPGEDWIVNSTLPFEELNQPLNSMIVRLLVMSSLFLLLLGIFVYITTLIRLRAENQKKEIAYLKEINEGMELVRHKEEELQHYQRVQSIGQMSSHIAHEFNNYLTPVMVYGELLSEDETLSKEDHELVKGILNSAGQAAGLSRRLLDFSRQDSGTTLGTQCLTEEVRSALEVIRRLVPETITFTAEIADKPLYIRGRAQMAEHLLMNLCNNAFHAMENGGTLTVRLEEAHGSAGIPEGDWALLSVADTGCGISRDAMDKIFEPFYTTKRSGKGTGLGLSVVQNTVTALGGHIRVESTEGRGTTFYLYFPETGPEDKAARPLVRPSDRIVVVDDDPEVLKAVGALLKGLRCKAECDSHPAAVLSKLQSQKDYCDVLITDYAMPTMNGLELAEIVRKLNPSIRLILISGMEDKRFEWYLKNEFIDAFILKSELAETLTKILK